MPITKYQRSDVAGEEWKRAARIIFENPPTGDFKVRFAEERAVALADGTVLSKPIGVLEDGRTEDQLDESFELIDSATGLGSGSFMTYAQLHTALYSLYLKASIEYHGTPPVEEPTDPPPE
jgi:hypothetical protein